MSGALLKVEDIHVYYGSIHAIKGYLLKKTIFYYYFHNSIIICGERGHHLRKRC